MGLRGFITGKHGGASRYAGIGCAPRKSVPKLSHRKPALGGVGKAKPGRIELRAECVYIEPISKPERRGTVCYWISEMTQARTEHGQFRFTVKECEDGTPYITAEPLRGLITAFKDADVGFGLPAGSTLDQAKRVADFMNQNLPSMFLTVFDTHPLYATNMV